MRIPMETYSACDFPGVWTSAPHPLWSHPCCLRVAESTHFTCILIVRWSQVSFHGLARIMKGNTHSTTYQFSEGSQVIGQFRLHSSDFFSNMSKLYSRKSVIY